MSEIINLEVTDEFRSRKRNLLWFSSVSILLAVTEPLADGMAEVPTIGLTINMGWLAMGFIAAVAYAYWGFCTEARMIRNRHSKASEKQQFPSFHARFTAFGDDIADVVKGARQLLENQAVLTISEPDGALLWHSTSVQAVDSITQHVEKVAAQARPATDEGMDPLYVSALEAQAAFNAAFHAGGAQNSDWHSEVRKFQRACQNVRDMTSHLDILARTLSDLGRDLDTISTNVNRGQLRVFRYHDVWAVHAVAIAALAAAVFVAVRAFA